MDVTDSLSFQDLLAMKIEDRKALAHSILAAGKGLAFREMAQGEWGSFTSIGKEASDTQIDEAVEGLIGAMTLRQKVAQMTPNTTVEEYVPACLKYNDRPYVAGEDADLGIPGLRFTDGPTGIVMGRGSTCFPVSIARAASWNTELELMIGEAMGQEARSLGANLFAGVCVNIPRHPGWGRSQESYGEDPKLAGAMGAALVRGVQRHIMAGVKHFALNSMENARYKVDVEVDERSLREVYLPHFKACIDAGAAVVMAAYNKVRGEYCGHNAGLLRRILREDWGFEGIVISDFIFGIRDGKKAVFGGMDVEMPIPGHYGDRLVELVQRGEVPETLIDESVRRILRTKMRFARRLGGQPKPERGPGCAEHRALARRAALESAVLLKNADGILPFDASTQKKIAVLGRLAATPNTGDMKGSSRVYPSYVITPLQGLRDKLGSQVDVAWSDGRDARELAATLAGADAAVVVVGLTSDEEGEYIPHWNSGCGGDRIDLGLAQADIDLIRKVAAACRKVVVVLQGGGVILTEPWERDIGALLMTWYPGMEGGAALADILYGDWNPCGRLPVTIPLPGQLPPFDRDALQVRYGYYHGYFLADAESRPVSHAFGAGLSYTRYEYSGLQISDSSPKENENITISVSVSNTGSRAGIETVQIYASCLDTQVERHVKDLVGFGRLDLGPGETKVFSHTLKLKNLAWYDESRNDWIVQKGRYRLQVGPSSRSPQLLDAEFRIE